MSCVPACVYFMTDWKNWKNDRFFNLFKVFFIGASSKENVSSTLLRYSISSFVWIGTLSRRSCFSSMCLVLEDTQAVVSKQKCWRQQHRRYSSTATRYRRALPDCLSSTSWSRGTMLVLWTIFVSHKRPKAKWTWLLEVTPVRSQKPKIVSFLEHFLVEGEVEMNLPSFHLCLTPHTFKKPRGNTRYKLLFHLIVCGSYA